MSADADDIARRAVHDALSGYLEDGEIAVAWTLTIDVAGPNDKRYLQHRAGGGHDGTDAPMAWAALGMLRASMQSAEDQLRDTNRAFAGDDDQEGDDD